VTTVEAAATVAVEPKHHRFTTTEYYAMAEAGIFGPKLRTELIEGEIYDKMTPGPKHSFSTNDLGNEFKDRLGRRVRVWTQSPLHLGRGSVPEPDLMLLHPRRERYRSRHPAVEDVLLVIEVSDTTLAFDRTRKIPMYARAGIPEVWVVNLIDRVIETWSDPVDGTYQEQRTYKPGESIAPKAFTDCQLPVDDVLA
jgi:Uma2 family endonuclease